MVFQRKDGGNTRRILVLITVLLLMLSVAGCGTKTKQPSYPGDGGASLTFVDDMGRKVTIKRPERIVSLAPSSTEILFALGLGDKVVGVDDYSDYPADVSKIDKVGGYNKPSLEKIVALKPDLVLADSIHEETVKKLEELGIPVAVVSPQDLEGVLTSIRWIGIATGANEQAAQLEAKLLERIRLVDEKVATIPQEERPWVYYEVFSDPIMTAGPNTLSSELIVRAGGRNIAYDAATDYPEVSPEAIVSRNPDVIIFPEVHGTGSVQAETIKSRPGWGTIKAIQNGRLYSIDANIISRSGPRVVEALERLVQLFYQE
jgi:iron complex transport system substrate-binding protein